MQTLLCGEVTDFPSLSCGASFLIGGRTSGHFAIKVAQSSGQPFVGAVVLTPPDPNDGAPIFWLENAINRSSVLHLPLVKLMPTKDPTKISLDTGRNFELGALYQSGTQLVMAALADRRTIFFDVNTGELQPSPPTGPTACIYSWKLVYPRGNNYEELASFECERRRQWA
jgi:hypothetical protein